MRLIVTHEQPDFDALASLALAKLLYPGSTATIQGALSRIEGIVSAEPDLEKHTMSVTYNSTKLSIKNVEFLIAGVGFDANDEKGKPEAKAALPAGCR